jgi:hypothetical protein
MSDPTSALVRALSRHFPDFRVEQAESRLWGSGAIAGTRHRIGFSSQGERSDACADLFLADLGSDGFEMRGHLLADIALVSDERSGSNVDRSVRIAIEALTIEQA